MLTTTSATTVPLDIVGPAQVHELGQTEHRLKTLALAKTSGRKKRQETNTLSTTKELPINHRMAKEEVLDDDTDPPDILDLRTTPTAVGGLV